MRMGHWPLVNGALALYPFDAPVLVAPSDAPV